MASRNYWYEDKMAELDRRLEDKYNDPLAKPTGQIAFEKAMATYLPLSEGKALCFGRNPVLREKATLKQSYKDRRRYGKSLGFDKKPMSYKKFKKSWKQSFFKKKNFYYTLKDKKDAVIIAASVKDARKPLVIPARLGKHRVIGVSDIKLDNKRYRIPKEALQISFSEHTENKKKTIFSMLSFTNLRGHEALEQTVLRDEAEVITVSGTVKKLMLAMLPNARVLHLPSTLLYLGEIYAPRLERIEIYDCGNPEGECTVHNAAFSLCEKLERLSLPWGVKELPKDIFYSLKELRYLELHPGLLDIGSGLLERITQLDELHVKCQKLKGDTVCRAKKAYLASESYKSFSGEIDSLILTDIPRGIAKIPARITELVLPDYVEIIGSSALENQNKLSGINLPTSLSQIGASAFSGCGITEIEIPDSVEEIGQNAFADCVSLASVKLPSSLKKINTNTFAGCSALSELEIPDGVEKICHAEAYNRSNIHPENSSAKLAVDLRALGLRESVDALWRVKLSAKPGTPASGALADYYQKIQESISTYKLAIKDYLYPDGNFKVVHENIDHVSASIRYLAYMEKEDKSMLLKLTEGLAEFFDRTTDALGDEEEFRYANYFYETLNNLKLSGQREAYDVLNKCKSALLERISSSVRIAMHAEKLFSENTSTSRDKAFCELVRAYRIYPRNAPVLIALIQWFASDPELCDTKAPDKFVELIEKFNGDNEDDTDYAGKAKQILGELRAVNIQIQSRNLSKKEKRELWFSDMNSGSSITLGNYPLTPSSFLHKSPSVPLNLSLRIDAEFFDSLRKEVGNRLISSFGGDAEYGKYAKVRKLDAIDRVEAIIDPKKREALKLALKKRREEEEKQRRENEKAYKELLEKSSKQTFTSSSYSSSSYMPSYSPSTRYEKTEGNFDSEFFPFTGYSFSYNNPYSSITDLGNWSQAEAIGIEWDVIDHDYFTDLGIFGDHSL